MEIWNKCWKCELCGHQWLSDGKEPPTQCVKCKSRHWDKSGKRVDDVESPEKLAKAVETVTGRTVKDINALAAHFKAPVRAVESQPQEDSFTDTVTVLDEDLPIEYD
jgi:hypothetical protein